MAALVKTVAASQTGSGTRLQTAHKEQSGALLKEEIIHFIEFITSKFEIKLFKTNT